MIGTNISGTAANLTAGTVTTNANLTGDITSIGNATSLTATGVTAGVYGSAALTPVITVDANGRITLVTTIAAASLQEDAVEVAAATGQTSFTLTNSPSIKCLVKMFINGVLISQSAHTNSSTSETYIPSSNGGYFLVAGDRIQLYYSY